jgi:Tfp pilus assembly protein PilF
MYYLTRARHELRQPNADVSAIHRDFEKALSLDPQNVETRLEFADLLQKWNDRRAAAEQYRRALETNRGYDEKEPERLSPQRLQQLEVLIKELGV